MKRNLLTIAFLLITIMAFADKGKTKAKTTSDTGSKSNSITFGGGTTRTDKVPNN
jgi:hypothetical protein